MNQPAAFQPGFRLSVTDVIVLMLGAGGAIAAARIDPWLGFAVAFPVAHFFLFCNVVRMSRPYELVWAAAFVSLAAAQLVLGVPSWPVVFLTCLAVTCVVVVLQARQPSYHGVFWQRLNPGLAQWWASRQGANAP
ncbi:MAG: hypothetical protein ABW051_07165 [Burkholderiaceae bacterium]